MIDLHPPPFGFVVDTEEYAGNFERDMCAWITGLYGDCERGREIANVARLQIPADVLKWGDDFVCQVADDHGCWRPCSIWTTPGWVNDGRGHHARGEDGYQAYLSVMIFAAQEPPPHVLAVWKERAESFATEAPLGQWSSRPKPTGFRLFQFRLVETEIAV